VALEGVITAVSVTGPPNTDGFGDPKSETALGICAARNCGKKIRTRASLEKTEDTRQEVNICLSGTDGDLLASHPGRPRGTHESLA
jgi:hypothetical protein